MNKTSSKAQSIVEEERLTDFFDLLIKIDDRINAAQIQQQERVRIKEVENGRFQNLLWLWGTTI